MTCVWLSKGIFDSLFSCKPLVVEPNNPIKASIKLRLKLLCEKMWIGDDANINFNFTCKIDWNSFCYKGSFVRLANVSFILLILCLTVYITNEGKWIEESTIVQCGGAKAQDGKMRWIIITKTTMGVIINLKNSHLLTWSLPTEDLF